MSPHAQEKMCIAALKHINVFPISATCSMLMLALLSPFRKEGDVSSKKKGDTGAEGSKKVVC